MHPDGLNLSEEQELELDWRLLVHERDPETGVPWDQALKALRTMPRARGSSHANGI